ncbi:MAG: HD domain-containing protein [Actinomycetota bacterium]
MNEHQIDQLLSLYRGEAASTRYDESVTELEHALQSAALAEAAGSDDALIAAALLHDVGHLVLRDHVPVGEALEVDHRHEEAGADTLASLFGPDVAEPVRHHVAAKRYLCAVEDDYFDRLSPASVRSLEVQGGPMSADEVAAFEALPFFEQAVQVRRWDEEAKVAGASVPSLENWELLLNGLARRFQQA